MTEPDLSRALAAIFEFIDDPRTAMDLRVALTRSTKRVSIKNRDLILKLANKVDRRHGIVLRRAYA